MNLTLISHKLCPYVQRVAIVLVEKRARYERVDVDLRDKPQWFHNISPLGKTPVLRVGDESVFESAVICEYLEDTIAPPLHPADPLRRAQHRAWIEFASVTLNDIASLYAAQDEQRLRAVHEALGRRIAQLEAVVGGPYFEGERFSLVDAAFAPAFRYFELFDAVLDYNLFASAPKVVAWRARLAERTSVTQAVPANYHALLRQFVVEKGAMLGRRLAELQA
jgi:glutathione S-transferase